METRKRSEAGQGSKTKRGQGCGVPHWQIVENIVAAVERSQLPDSKVIQKAMVPTRNSSKRREVDILVKHKLGPRQVSIGIDVKNEKRPLDITDIEQLYAKAESLVLDRYCVVSTSGFVKGVDELARLHKIDLLTMESFQQSSVWAYPPGMQAFENQVELIDATILFPTKEEQALSRIRQIADGARLDEIFIRDNGGEASLLKCLNHYGVQATNTINLEAKSQIQPGTRRFTVNLSIPPGAWLQVRCPRGELPVPEMIVALFQVTRTETLVAEHRFRYLDVEASSTVMKIGDQTRQFTIVTSPVEHGLNEIKLSVGPAKPKRTNV